MTGYIAGDALYALSQKYPDYEYSALVRTQEKADIVKKAFPNIRIVLGGNDDSDILREEAAKADVVLRTSPLTINLTTNLTLTISQTPPMPPTTKVPQRPSPKAFAPATLKRTQATGCTPAAQAS